MFNDQNVMCLRFQKGWSKLMRILLVSRAWEILMLYWQMKITFWAGHREFCYVGRWIVCLRQIQLAVYFIDRQEHNGEIISKMKNQYSESVKSAEKAVIGMTIDLVTDYIRKESGFNLTCHDSKFTTRWKIKEKYQLIYIFEITSMRNVCLRNMLVIIISEHFKDWIVLILFFLCCLDTFGVVYIWVLNDLKNLNLKFLKNIILSSLVYSH